MQDAEMEALSHGVDAGAVDLLLEERLRAVLSPGDSPLQQAMRDVVFAGGKRIRPRLLLRVALSNAVDGAALDLALRAAAAVELIHSASLVHDDLPCFDDAPVRRGKPTVHVSYGEPIAVLTGDALLTLAFETLSDVPDSLAQRALRLVRTLGEATGASSGIIGGQAMEFSADGKSAPLSSSALLDRYHAMKTGALFRWAALAGSLVAGGGNQRQWATVGEHIGRWYQLADDYIDARGDQGRALKPVGTDARLQRPNAVALLGDDEVAARMHRIFDEVAEYVVRLAPQPAAMLQVLGELRAQIDHIVGPRSGVLV